MPVWAVQIVLAVIPLIGKVIDKVFPEKHTPTFRRISRKMTIEQIAKIGKKGGKI